MDYTTTTMVFTVPSLLTTTDSPHGDTQAITEVSSHPPTPQELADTDRAMGIALLLIVLVYAATLLIIALGCHRKG